MGSCSVSFNLTTLKDVSANCMYKCELGYKNTCLSISGALRAYMVQKNESRNTMNILRMLDGLISSYRLRSWGKDI